MAHLAAGATITTGDEDRKRDLWIPVLLCALALTVESYFVFHDLKPVTRKSAHSDGAPLATYLYGVNQVRQKASGTISWSVPEESTALYREDTIATMADSRARIQFGDLSEIEVEPESLIVLEEAPSAQNTQTGAQAPKIVARLVRGTIVRKKSGTAPLFVKLSDGKDAAQIRFDDSKGDALFRIIRKGFGVEVIVESGTVSVNGSSPIDHHQTASVSGDAPDQVQINTAPPAPKLKEPRVRIRHNGEQSNFWRDLLIRSAYAEETVTDITVDFEWEPSPGAKSYRIQVSKDSNFLEITLDAVVATEKYEYHTHAENHDSQVFFRVAAIGENGNQGLFSSIETVTIHPDPTPSVVAPSPSPTPSSVSSPSPSPKFTPKPIPTFTPSSTPTPVATNPPIAQSVEKPVPTPEPTLAKKIESEHPVERPSPAPIPSKPREPAIVLSKHWFFEGSYGAGYQYRQFKNASEPATAHGSGLVPSQLGAELTFFDASKYYYQIDFSAALEKAQPLQDGAPYGGKLTVPDYKARFATLNDWSGVYFGIGPYVATTSRIQWTGSQLASSQKVLFGGTLSLSSTPVASRSIQWQMEVNPLFLGTLGADFQLKFKKRLSGFFRDEPWLGGSGFFLGLDGDGRFARDETGYSASVGLGYLF